MRIWHEQLITKLCQKHLCAMWREGLGCYKIVTGQVDGGSYKNHLQVKEFEYAPLALYWRLRAVRDEMLRRNYNPKLLKSPRSLLIRSVLGLYKDKIKPWQTLGQQIKILQSKDCDCEV